MLLLEEEEKERDGLKEEVGGGGENVYSKERQRQKQQQQQQEQGHLIHLWKVNEQNHFDRCKQTLRSNWQTCLKLTSLTLSTAASFISVSEIRD